MTIIVGPCPSAVASDAFFKIGHQAVNANLQAYYNVVTPDDIGANWQLRATWTFLFPTH
jgi:hypothetical protein